MLCHLSDSTWTWFKDLGRDLNLSQVYLRLLAVWNDLRPQLNWSQTWSLTWTRLKNILLIQDLDFCHIALDVTWICLEWVKTWPGFKWLEAWLQTETWFKVSLNNLRPDLKLQEWLEDVTWTNQILLDCLKWLETVWKTRDLTYQTCVKCLETWQKEAQPLNEQHEFYLDLLLQDLA